MGWLDYYKILLRYGSYENAPGEELLKAEVANPNDPWAARKIAKAKYREVIGAGKLREEMEKWGIEPSPLQLLGWLVGEWNREIGWLENEGWYLERSKEYDSGTAVGEAEGAAMAYKRAILHGIRLGLWTLDDIKDKELRETIGAMMGEGA